MFGQFQEQKGLEVIPAFNQFQATTISSGGNSHQHHHEGNYYTRPRPDYPIF